MRDGPTKGLRDTDLYRIVLRPGVLERLLPRLRVTVVVVDIFLTWLDTHVDLKIQTEEHR